jgi:TetR/AcrR family transcriptional regulator, lmrAB and yxaGH operons repressor
MVRQIAERADVIPLLAEVFRTHGYDGASLSAITAATGLGKGSLYHFFPGGKEEMAAAVLAQIEQWFETNVFAPLRGNDPARAIPAMFEAVDTYFHAGGRVCLVGVFALSDTRDRYFRDIQRYFATWVATLAAALEALGHAPPVALDLAEEIVGGIQGGLVLARAAGQPQLFARTLARLRSRTKIA